MSARVSSDSIREATTRGWPEWVAALDAAGAAGWSHREIVAYLQTEYPEVSSWWRQSITVGYEQARGRRAAGETASTGFQVGVQRSIAATATRVWELIVARPELWLGDGASAVVAKGEPYTAAEASGQIRVVRPGHRLRFTWQPRGWPAPATVQLTLLRSGSGRTALHAHVEKLPDQDSRETMREHWRTVLERIAATA